MTKPCLLVIIAADALGHKDIVGLVDGCRESAQRRESAQSWKELLLDLKRRGLQAGPELAVGDGALGFLEGAARSVRQAREQRCWAHKTANVLKQMPKR